MDQNIMIYSGFVIEKPRCNTTGAAPDKKNIISINQKISLILHNKYEQVKEKNTQSIKIIEKSGDSSGGSWKR